MEIELQEIRDFIAQQAPFDVLPQKTLDTLPAKLQVRYLRRGEKFPPAGVGGAFLYILRTGAVELRDEQGLLVDKLAEGDFYSDSCRAGNHSPQHAAVTSEDSLLYLLPCSELDRLLDDSSLFGEHFSESIHARLKLAVNSMQSRSTGSTNALATQVGDLLSRGPVTIGTGNSIQAAAQVMVEEKVSALMILEDGHLAGLVTDSDLRRRCIASGLPTDRPIADIMTRDIRSIEHTMLASDALLLMTELRLHHLPVLTHGQLSGLVSASDLIRLQSHNPAFISVAARKAQSVTALRKLAMRLPELQLQLSRTGISAQHIGDAMASISDAITCRLIELAEAELGAPPVPYVWLAGGSQGRREQTSHTDQDNALLISDAFEDRHKDYFEALTRFVCDGLDACGYSYCPGEAMASNERWRQPLHVWRRYFSDWTRQPEPRALMLASIFFDLRPVQGDNSLYAALQEDILSNCKESRIFIAYLVSNALGHRPPLGFFRNLVLIHGGDHKDTLDIKHRGITPIVDIARIYALSGGIPAISTNERLKLACETGALGADMYASLVDAFELISTLRIRHQVDRMIRGLPPDNYLSPNELSRLERGHLKDAFSIIKNLQETLANRHQTGHFG